MRAYRHAIAVIALCCSVLVACSGHVGRIDPDVARFAQFPGTAPNWILPITDPGHNATPNTMQFSFLLWRTLYWQGKGTEPTVDQSLSLADPPKYSHRNRRVTIKLRDYDWSDGRPVTARDVEFWLDLIRFNPDRWSGYVKGNIPDSIKKFTAVDAKTFTLDLTAPVSPNWFTNNQLTQIVPLPRHAWDRKTTGGPTGNFDRTKAGARAVLDYLFGEAKKLSTYQRNPLWQIVDGPWKLEHFSSDGHIDFVPNKRYSGKDKPTIKRFSEIPFTAEESEFNTLLAGGVDYGYLPFKDLNQGVLEQNDDYQMVPWQLWGINYMTINFNNAKTGPLVRRLYIRQALQSLVDQPLIIKYLFKGQGAQNFGPVPLSPENPYTTVTKNPYPYDAEKAVSLLRKHGWAVHPKGATSCTRPGTGPDECGAGIVKGAKLALTSEVTSGRKPVLLEMQTLQSEFKKTAGIEFDVHPTPYAQILTDVFAPCTRKKPGACQWQTGVWGGGSSLAPYPTGEDVFESTGAGNSEHFSDPKADRLIDASLRGGTAELREYEQYLVKQLPVIWVPNPTYQLSMINKKLLGASEQNPYTALTPERWHWK